MIQGTRPARRTVALRATILAEAMDPARLTVGHTTGAHQANYRKLTEGEL